MIIAITAFLFAVSVMAFEWIDKTVGVLLAVVVLGITHVVPFEHMIDMVDFTTVILLLGLMLLVEVTEQSQVLEWLNVQIVRKTKGNPLRLFVVFALLTFFLSTFLANATTMMILVPLTVAVTRAMGINPKPYVIAEIIFSDIGGALTIIGDPSNVMISSATGLGFMEFSRVMIVPLSVIILMFLAILIRLYWDDVKPIAKSLTKLFMTNMLAGKIEHQFRKSNFNLNFARISVSVFTLVVLAMIFDFWNLPIEYTALGGSAVMLLCTRKYVKIEHVFAKVDAHTLLFFAGLFIIVGALEETGALSHLTDFIGAHADTALEVSLFTLWTVGLLSAFVENIPLVALMIPVLQSLIGTGALSGDTGIVWYALSLGACLGGNGSLLGSSANILGAQLAHKNGVHVSFMEYFRIGYPLTILSLLISTVFLWFIA